MSNSESDGKMTDLARRIVASRLYNGGESKPIDDLINRLESDEVNEEEFTIPDEDKCNVEEFLDGF